MQAARAAFLQAQTLMLALEQELPDTAAALRLSGLELSDCFEEMSLLRCAWMQARTVGRVRQLAPGRRGWLTGRRC